MLNKVLRIESSEQEPNSFSITIKLALALAKNYEP